MTSFEQLKNATDLVTNLPEVPEPERKEPERVKLGAKHKEHRAWLEGKGYGEWDEAKHLLNTHTTHVEEMCEHFDLPGEFETDATGREGPQDRNCCLIPRKRGLWLCVRYNSAPESGPNWTTNLKGHATCVVGKAPTKPRIDHADTMVADAQSLDTFFSWEGVAYVRTVRRGRKETLLVGSTMYSRLLRVRYRKMHGRVCKAEWIRNAVDQLMAIAIEEGEEIPVFCRVAHVGDKIFIDLADRDRRVVEIDPDNPDGWGVIDTAPVHFLHTEKMRPLPVPERGGTLQELRPFVNVESQDFSLLVGVLLGMFLPEGTFPVTVIIGGDGRAKTCLALIILLLIDPTIVKGCSPPETNEDLILSVQQRFVYFVDNISQLKPWLSDGFCRLASGGATERRTKYRDSDTSVFIAKRPVLIASILDVIRSYPDLVSRSIKFDLPSVRNTRKREAKLFKDFNDARPKILGALYTAISAALRNLPNTTDDNLPRLADWAAWVKAAEPATGLEPGSILKTYHAAKKADVRDLLSSDLAQKVIRFATQKKWEGTGKDLAKELEITQTLDSQVQEFVSDLRRLQTAMESQGIVVGFRRSNGYRLISVQKVPEPPLEAVRPDSRHPQR